MDLTDRLLQIGERVPREQFFSAATDEHTQFALSDPFAFLMASCLDRGANSARIWSIPLDLKLALGHLEAPALAKVDSEALTGVLASLPSKPRYMRDAPRTIQELSQLVIRMPGAQANLVWEHRTATDVKRDLLALHGVGEGLANMTVLLIERAYGRQFDDMDRGRVDIKADVHTMRVLARLGVAREATAQAAIEAARSLNPDFPGALDGGLWWVGREWCRPGSPLCGECELSDLCGRVGAGGSVA